jgi:hypothetical protein
MSLDRQALVRRHCLATQDPAARLALGNGEFCATVDGTGLQTFGGNCMAHWGWHRFPLPDDWPQDRVPATGTFQQGRNTGPDRFPPGTEAIRQWLFDNPHIFNLGRLRVLYAGQPVAVRPVQRTLDLWTGIHDTRYDIGAQPVRVQTCVHPGLDLVAVRIESALRLEVVLDFPYPALKNDAWVGDFARADGHATVPERRSDRRENIRRIVDGTTYHVALEAQPGCVVAGGRVTGDALALVCGFSPDAWPAALPSVEATMSACAASWERFWSTGGAIDLSASADPRWPELERRLVLSQYQMAAQSAGSWCSSETGLLGIDPWRGQFHMEMLWWHLAHYALWDRWALATRALDCYPRFAPAARALASQLGYQGLKWPKSVGPEGRSAPWYGNQVLLWKQPHPIFFAELDYRLHPTRATLEKWADIIQGTAEHMADYPVKDDATGCFHLAPAMPPSEQGITRDPVFDLAYWRWGLDQAQTWRERLGLPREPRWDWVRKHLAPLPVVDGVFVHSAEWTDTYTRRAWEHPDPVGVLGMLPPIEGVDPRVARDTVARVWSTWDWNRCWGWDFPWMAMAAARTGQPALAVEALLRDSRRNQYDFQGVNTGGPCPYLPGNGGLLYAVALMAAGWEGAPSRHAPGFPEDGGWNVRWEGLQRAL